MLRDLVKLENDLLYIFTPIQSEAQFKEAIQLINIILDVDDLGKRFEPPAQKFEHDELNCTLETVALLRSFYPDLV